MDTVANLGQEAIEALVSFAQAGGSEDQASALARVERELGGDALDSLRPLLNTMARHGQELQSLRELALTDHMTGASNRRGYEQALHAEISRHHRHGETFALLFLDLDDLKPRNDRFGHAAGDAALMRVAKIAREVARDTDTVARLGGDEFAMILPGAGQQGARAAARRVREAIESERDEFGPLRVSIGLSATDSHGSSIEDLESAADQSLYEDKVERKGAARYSRAAGSLSESAA